MTWPAPNPRARKYNTWTDVRGLPRNPTVDCRCLPYWESDHPDHVCTCDPYPKSDADDAASSERRPESDMSADIPTEPCDTP